MKNLWLVQYLCPNRHAIVAAPYDRDATASIEIEVMLIDAMQPAQVKSWCAMCGSHELAFDHGKLRYTEWDDGAWAALREVELEQAYTRLLVDQIRESN